MVETPQPIYLLTAALVAGIGLPEEAIVQFQEVIRLNAKNADACLRLGMALVKQEKLEKAIANLTTARDLFETLSNPQKAARIDRLL